MKKQLRGNCVHRRFDGRHRRLMFERCEERLALSGSSVVPVYAAPLEGGFISLDAGDYLLTASNTFLDAGSIGSQLRIRGIAAQTIIQFNSDSDAWTSSNSFATFGVLTNTLRQARMNLGLSGIQYEKVREDFSFRIIEAYYDLMKTQMSRKIQKGLWEEGQEAKGQAEARYERGRSRLMEVLNVRTQMNQISVQLASAEQDLVLARYKFKELLSQQKGGFYKVPKVKYSEELQFEPIEINLNEVLKLSRRNNLDIQIADSQVKVSHYEQKIAKGKGGFRVDLTGFIGKAGSNFETEDLVLRDEHSIGIRVSRIFGGTELGPFLLV